MSIVAVAGLIALGAAIFFLVVPYWERRDMESKMLLPSRVEMYPDANTCREFYRSSVQPENARQTIRIMVSCPKCSKRLVIVLKPTYKREGRWLIRQRPIRCKVKCPHCTSVFSGRTVATYAVQPPTTEVKGQPPQ